MSGEAADLNAELFPDGSGDALTDPEPAAPPPPEMEAVQVQEQGCPTLTTWHACSHVNHLFMMMPACGMLQPAQTLHPPLPALRSIAPAHLHRA